MAKAFDLDTVKREVAFAFERYPDRGGQILNVLDYIQARFGYISDETVEEVSRLSGLESTAIEAVCDFFQVFSRSPLGEHVIEVCDGTACHTKGSPDLVRAFETALGVRVGGTTPDGRFTLRTVRCVGACNMASVVVVDEGVCGRVKLKEVSSLVRSVS